MGVTGGLTASLGVEDLFIYRCAFKYEWSDGAWSIGGS